MKAITEDFKDGKLLAVCGGKGAANAASAYCTARVMLTKLPPKKVIRIKLLNLSTEDIKYINWQLATYGKAYYQDANHKFEFPKHIKAWSMQVRSAMKAKTRQALAQK